MATWKLTMLIELTSGSTQGAVQQRVGGWSESFYDQVIQAPFEAFEELCRLRAALLPTGGRVVGQRYQPIDPVGQTQLAAKVFPATSGILSDAPQMALYCRAKGQGVSNIRPLILRGIPDARVVEGEYNPSDGFQRALNAYFAQLRNAQFRFKGRNLTAQEVPIETIDTNGNFVLVLPLTFAVGDQLQVMGAEGSFGEKFSGFFYVSARTDSTHGKLGLWKNGATERGVVRQAGTVYPLFGDVDVSRVIVRKVGRPFTGYRGRRTRKR